MTNKGKLVVNIGSMFSGKTTELLRQGKRHVLAKQKVLYVKPEIDTRYSDTEVVSHDGASSDFTKSIVVYTDAYLEDIPEIKEADVILVDEVQFFTPEVAEQLSHLATDGKQIYVSGLDMTFTGEPFMTTAVIMALADEVNKFKAVCSVCGADGYGSALIDDTSLEIIQLGHTDKYMPMCRECFDKYIYGVLEV